MTSELGLEIQEPLRKFGLFSFTQCLVETEEIQFSNNKIPMNVLIWNINHVFRMNTIHSILEQNFEITFENSSRCFNRPASPAKFQLVLFSLISSKDQGLSQDFTLESLKR